MYILPWHLTPRPYVESKNVLAIYKPQAKIVTNMIASVKNVRVVGITLHTAWFYVYLTMSFDSKAIRGIQKRTCHLQTSGKDYVKYDSIRQKCKSSWHYTPYSLILCIFYHDIWLQGHTWTPKAFLISTHKTVHDQAWNPIHNGINKYATDPLPPQPSGVGNLYFKGHIFAQYSVVGQRRELCWKTKTLSLVMLFSRK